MQDIINEIKNEIAAERDAVIQNAIEERLKNFVFDEKNLSPTLIALLMAKSGSGAQFKLPIIEGEQIPIPAQDTSEEVLDFINVNVTEIVNDLAVANNVYLYGKAGTGKTTLAKKIARDILKKKTFTINCNQFTSPVEIRGGQTIEGYKDGNMTMAWEQGAVLILDELPKLDPNTAGLLNEALAASADQPTKLKITKEQYEIFEMELEEAAKEDKYLGYSLYMDNGEYIRENDVTITDGKGDLRKRGKGFCVIGTGNTDMKTTSTNYSGNNRQDYSLVDRFAGSFYKIDYDPSLERKLTYEKVYNVSMVLREFLDKAGTIEFISLRTMLNFNRIYEQEMLRKIGSKYAIPVIEIKTESGEEYVGKTLADSVLQGFINTLPDKAQLDLRRDTDIDRLLVMDTPEELFIEEFIRLHGVNPLTGDKA